LAGQFTAVAVPSILSRRDGYDLDGDGTQELVYGTSTARFTRSAVTETRSRAGPPS
jgi:hypothetical protein